MLPKGLLKEYSKTLSMLVRGLDIFAVLLAGLLAFGCKMGDFNLTLNYLLALGLAAVFTSIVFSCCHIYESVRAQSLWQSLSRLVQAIFILLLFLAGLAFITKTGESFSRGWFVLWAIFSFVLLIFSRFCLLLTLRLMRKRGLN